jgi:hypothetical protein
MNRGEYLSAVNEFIYQGEVFGEAILASYLALETDAEHRYKWATLMQLETETKARLRPFLARLGLGVAQNDVSDKVAGFAKAFASKSWQQHMKEIAEITDFYLAKFREIHSAAPPEDREVTQSMVVHEAAIGRFAQLELSGQADSSLDEVIAQLKYPLPAPGKAQFARAS